MTVVEERIERVSTTVPLNWNEVWFMLLPDRASGTLHPGNEHD